MVVGVHVGRRGWKVQLAWESMQIDVARVPADIIGQRFPVRRASVTRPAAVDVMP